MKRFDFLGRVLAAPIVAAVLPTLSRLAPVAPRWFGSYPAIQEGETFLEIEGPTANAMFRIEYDVVDVARLRQLLANGWSPSARVMWHFSDGRFAPGESLRSLIQRSAP